MLTVIDFIVIILFITVVVTMYKVLRPEEMDIKEILITKTNNKKLIKKVINSKKLPKIILKGLSEESIETKVDKLSKMDKNFTPQSFMEKSKVYFKEILDSFEKKDRERLKKYVSQKVYKIFDENMKELEEKNQILDSEIIRFKRILIKDIKIEDKIANIIVEFTSEQTTVLRDKDNKIIKGDDNQIEVIRDEWKFTKDMSKKNEEWILTETIEE